MFSQKNHIFLKVSLTCVFDERQFDCGTTFLSTANPALVLGDKVGQLMLMVIVNMISVYNGLHD